MKNVEISDVKNTIISFKDIGMKDCYVSVTEWANGEGFDIEVNDGSTQTISLHYDSFYAINAAINLMGLNINDK